MKEVRHVVGMMSGTSVDGVDAALVEISGTDSEPKVKLLAFENKPYPPQVREKIFSLFTPANATVDKVGYMNFLLGEIYAKSALSVIEKAGMKPFIEAVRGGTDGCRLSFMGLPTPNLCTGGFAFHGPYEHIAVESMDRCAKMVEYLMLGE